MDHCIAGSVLAATLVPSVEVDSQLSKNSNGFLRNEVRAIIPLTEQVEDILGKSTMLNLLIAEAPTIAANSC